MTRTIAILTALIGALTFPSAWAQGGMRQEGQHVSTMPTSMDALAHTALRQPQRFIAEIPLPSSMTPISETDENRLGERPMFILLLGGVSDIAPMAKIARDLKAQVPDFGFALYIVSAAQPRIPSPPTDLSIYWSGRHALSELSFLPLARAEPVIMVAGRNKRIYGILNPGRKPDFHFLDISREIAQRARTELAHIVADASSKKPSEGMPLWLLMNKHHYSGIPFQSPDVAPNGIAVPADLVSSLKGFAPKDHELGANFYYPGRQVSLASVWRGRESSVAPCEDSVSIWRCFNRAWLGFHSHPERALPFFSPADVALSAYYMKPMLMADYQGRMFLLLPTRDSVRYFAGRTLNAEWTIGMLDARTHIEDRCALREDKNPFADYLGLSAARKMGVVSYRLSQARAKPGEDLKFERIPASAAPRIGGDDVPLDQQVRANGRLHLTLAVWHLAMINAKAMADGKEAPRQAIPFDKNATGLQPIRSPLGTWSDEQLLNLAAQGIGMDLDYSLGPIAGPMAAKDSSLSIYKTRDCNRYIAEFIGLGRDIGNGNRQVLYMSENLTGQRWREITWEEYQANRPPAK